MGLMKKLASAVVVAGLVLSLVGTAGAAYSDPTANDAANRMVALGLVDKAADLKLGDSITRAQFVKIVDFAFGQGDNAKYLMGAASYPDVTADHWASGYIAMAKNLIGAQNQSMGMADGTFQPDATMTAAQAVAFLMKFVGVQPDNTKAWPDSYLSAAVAANFITSEDAATVAAQGNAPASRGLVFYLADYVFANYKLADGSTIYSKYVVKNAPTLSVDNDAAATTTDTKVTVTGKVTAGSVAVGTVSVGDQAVTVAADGTFTSDVALALGDNTIVVSAQDIAGTPAASKTIKVTRTVGAAASITANDLTVAAGQSADVAAAVLDANGNTITGAAVTGTLSDSALGTFDGAKFTAGTKAMSGTLVLTSTAATKTVNVTVTAGPLDKVVPSAASVAPGAKVTLSGQDQYGNTVTGVTYSQTSANALLDSANGAFIASAAGTYTVTGTAGGVSKDATIGVWDSTVDSYAIVSSSATLIANDNSTATLTITATDKNGNAILNNDDTVYLTVAGPALSYSLDNGDTWETADLGSQSGNSEADPVIPPGSPITLDDGVATVLVSTSGATGFGGATDTISVNDDTTANIDLVDQVATSLAVSNSATYLPSNHTDGSDYTVFSVSVKDQAGYSMLSSAGFYPIDVALNSGVSAELVTTAGDGAATSMISVDSGDTTGTGYYQGDALDVIVQPTASGASGTVTLTATATNLTSGSKSVTMQWAGPATKLVVTADSDNADKPVVSDAYSDAKDNIVTYDVTATDAAGVPQSDLTGVDENVVVALPGLSAGDGADYFWVSGTYDDGDLFTTDLQTLAAAAEPFVTYNSSTDTYQAKLSLNNGKASFTLATTVAGAMNFQVKDTNDELTDAAAQSVTFAPGSAVDMAFKVNGQSGDFFAVAPSTGNVQVVAQMKDKFGNNTTDAGESFTLTADDSASGGTTSDVTVNGNAKTDEVTVDDTGKAVFNVNVGSFVGAGYHFSFDSSDTNVTTTGDTGYDFALAIQNNVASRITYALYSDSTLKSPISATDAGTTVYVKATVKDASGRVAPDVNIAAYELNSDGTQGDEITTAELNNEVQPVLDSNDNVVDGTYWFKVTPETTPSQSFQIATVDSATAVTTNFSVGVRASKVADHLVIAGGDQTISSNTEKAVTIKLTDEFDNAIINRNTSGDPAVPANIDVTLTVTGADSDAIQIRTSSGGLAGGDIVIKPGATSVTVYVITNLSSGSFTLTATGAVHGGDVLPDDAATTANEATFTVQ